MIKVEVTNSDMYALSLLPGRNWKSDHERATDLPERRAIWKETDGGSVFSHWNVPRVDVQQIMKRWHRDEIDGDEAFFKDAKLFRKLITPLSDYEPIKGELNLPDDVTLEPHQEAYARISPLRRRLACTWPTGFGKSIAALARHMQLAPDGRLIVVSIQSMLDEWQEDLTWFCGIEPLVYVGPKRKQVFEQAKSSRVVLTTFDIGHELCFPFDSYVLDEVDLLQNPQTKMVKNFEPFIDLSWRKEVSFQLLTATPQGQYPRTVWNFVRMIHPVLAGSETGFQLYHEQFSHTVERKLPVRGANGAFYYAKKTEKVGIRLQNEKALRRKLVAFAVFADPKIKMPFHHEEKFLDVGMTDRQEEALQTLRDELYIDLDAGQLQVKDARTQALRILQVCESLANFEDDLAAESAKYQYCRRICKKAIKTNEPIVFWSRFRKVPELLYEEFKDCAVLFNGSLNKDQKKLAKWQFQGLKNESQLVEFRRLQKKYGGPAEPGSALFFFATIADRTSRGMNLHRCPRQYFLSISLSGKVMTQTKGRLLRMSQKNKLIETIYLISHPIEKQWHAYVNRKCADAKMASTGTENCSASQLRDLLRIAKRELKIDDDE
jgi:hypothetical protein